MQPTPPDLYPEMDSIYKSLEDELKITLDLDGDNFDFQLILPGVLTSTNADSLAGDTLFWSFDLTNFMNEDYVMSAESSIKYPKRKKAGIIFIIILGLVFIGSQLKKYFF